MTTAPKPEQAESTTSRETHFYLAGWNGAVLNLDATAHFQKAQASAPQCVATSAADASNPLDWPLPCDVTVGHGTISKGVKLSTLVLRMKVLYKMATGDDADEVAARTPEQRAQLSLSKIAATLAAAAPVVLPEPFALYDGEKWYANEEAAICSCADMEKLQKVFIESQLLTLLAGVSAPAAQCNSKLLNAARTLNALRAEYQRETDEVHPGNEHWSQRFSNGYAALMDAVIDVQLTSAAPQAQADARDAEQERWMAIGKAIERACIEQPDSTEIVISLERDAGTVTVFDPDGNEHDHFSHEDGLAGVINEAIDAAQAAQQGGAA